MVEGDTEALTESGIDFADRQNVKLIKSRVNGSHFGVVLYVANKVNDFGAIARYMEQYKKNSESDQV